MRELKIPGVSVAVFENGRIAWTRGWGMADVGEGRRVDADTRFQAASISKPVAAAAALALVSLGQLSLDDDINKHLTSWKLPANEFTHKEKVTLGHLLSHTGGVTVSGFRGYAGGRKCSDAPAGAQRRQAGELRSRARRHPGRHTLAIRRRRIFDRAARHRGHHQEAVRRRAARAGPRAARHVTQHLRPAAAREPSRQGGHRLPGVRRSDRGPLAHVSGAGGGRAVDDAGGSRAVCHRHPADGGRDGAAADHVARDRGADAEGAHGRLRARRRRHRCRAGGAIRPRRLE